MGKGWFEISNIQSSSCEIKNGIKVIRRAHIRGTKAIKVYLEIGIIHLMPETK